MKTIDNDIKAGEYKQAYLLYGEEQYLIRQYRDKLKKAMVAEDDTMNFSAFEGADINQNRSCRDAAFLCGPQSDPDRGQRAF